MSVEQPMLSDLMAAYLRRLAANPQAGLISGAAREVEPYDAVPTQVLDPVQTWNEATLAVRTHGLDVPTDSPTIWPSIVFAAESCTAVPMAVGQFPQSVRDLSQLARSLEGNSKPQPVLPPQAIDGLDSWISENSDSASWTDQCLAAGVARQARRFDDSIRLLKSVEKSAGRKSAALIANELASTHWQRGERGEAIKIWDSLPDSVPVLFNRGMAALFTGDRKRAQASLSTAIAALDDSTGWRHLARLYLALAESA